MTKRLSDATRRDFSVSKWLWLLLIAGQLGAFGVAGYAATQEKPPVGLLVFVIVAAPILQFIIRLAADHYQSRAETVRRVARAKDALGYEPSKAELLDIETTASQIPSLDPKPAGGDYFSSDLPKGLPRFAHCLQQSAFFTSRIASSAFRIYAFIAIAGLLATLFLAYALVRGLDPSTVAATASKTSDLLASIFVFFGTGAFATQAASYWRVAGTAARTVVVCDRLRQSSELTDADILLVTSEYDCAVAAAPPLPGRLYKLWQARLHDAWERHMSDADAVENAE